MLVAQLYTDARKNERIAAGRDATLRDAVERPIDIVVEDLSIGGFGMSTTENLLVGSILKLRIPGIGNREVRVVRRFGLNYGCEFAQSLRETELSAALSAGSVINGSFVGAAGTTAILGSPSKRLTPPQRIGVLLGMVGILWFGILLGIDHLV